MRSFLSPIFAVIATAVAGAVFCKVVGYNAHYSALFVAAAASIGASSLAILMLRRSRGADQAETAQICLLAMTIHLFVAAGISAVVLMGKFMGPPFMYWVLAFYGATLFALVAILARAVRAAPMPQSQKQS